MNLDTFEQASGFSVSWMNHWTVGLSGTLVLVAAIALVAMLTERFNVKDNISNFWVLAYILFVIMIVFLFLGFLNNFWR